MGFVGVLYRKLNREFSGGGGGAGKSLSRHLRETQTSEACPWLFYKSVRIRPQDQGCYGVLQAIVCNLSWKS